MVCGENSAVSELIKQPGVDGAEKQIAFARALARNGI